MNRRRFLLGFATVPIIPVAITSHILTKKKIIMNEVGICHGTVLMCTELTDSKCVLTKIGEPTYDA